MRGNSQDDVLLDKFLNFWEDFLYNGNLCLKIKKYVYFHYERAFLNNTIKSLQTQNILVFCIILYIKLFYR
jgi:hypothetical protein